MIGQAVAPLPAPFLAPCLDYPSSHQPLASPHSLAHAFTCLPLTSTGLPRAPPRTPLAEPACLSPPAPPLNPAHHLALAPTPTPVATSGGNAVCSPSHRGSGAGVLLSQISRSFSLNVNVRSGKQAQDQDVWLPPFLHHVWVVFLMLGENRGGSGGGDGGNDYV